MFNKNVKSPMVLSGGRMVMDPGKSLDNEAMCQYIYEQAGGDERYIELLRNDQDAFLDYAKEFRIKRLPRQVDITHGVSDQMVDALRQLREERAMLIEGAAHAVEEK